MISSLLMADSPLETQLETKRLLMDDLENVKRLRTYKQKRIARILAHKPMRGCEQIAARVQQRYKDEIEELDRQIELLESNLEGMTDG